MKKLQENLPCYQDKLGGTRVYTYFTAIFSKCRKFAKPEIKVSVCLVQLNAHLYVLILIVCCVYVYSCCCLQTLVDELEGKVEEMHKKYAAGEGESGEGETRRTDGANGEHGGSLRQPSHQDPLVAVESEYTQELTVPTSAQCDCVCCGWECVHTYIHMYVRMCNSLIHRNSCFLA